jgi:hypothetical protein
VTRIGELGTLAVTSNVCTLHCRIGQYEVCVIVALDNVRIVTNSRSQNLYLHCVFRYVCVRGSVDTATGYGRDESLLHNLPDGDWDLRCFLPMGVGALPLGPKRPRREAGPSLPVSTEVKETWLCAPGSPVGCHGAVLACLRHLRADVSACSGSVWFESCNCHA